MAGERIQIGVQVSPRVKNLLETAAEQNHRSLSREAEYRLEQSFERDRLSILERYITMLTDILLPGSWHRGEERGNELEDRRRVIEDLFREIDLVKKGEFAALSPDGPFAALKAEAERLKHPRGEEGGHAEESAGRTPRREKRTSSKGARA